MKKHILLIDDDGDEPDILCSALQCAGINHKCTWAQGVEHALCIMDYLVPDVIFIDINMPGIAGLRGIEMIRKRQHLQDVPLVLYSNCISPQNRERALALGATDCIQKPTTVNGLCEVMKIFFIRQASLHEAFENQ